MDDQHSESELQALREYKARLVEGLPKHVKESVIFAGYAQEAEHEEGLSYWRRFINSHALLVDYYVYLDALEAEVPGLG